MQNGMAGGQTYIAVDLHSLAAAASVVARLGSSLQGATTEAQREVQAGLAAIPPSDLFEAYAFCWGRWSAVLDDAQRAVVAAGPALGGSGAHFAGVDHQVARGIRDVPR
jgi:hypothetical protein